MKKDQVFVRARLANGKIAVCDVLDLDDESFRAFVIDVLFRHGLVFGIRDVLGEPIKFIARKSRRKA